MKVDRLESHDRLLHFGKQSDTLSYFCQSLIDQKPFGDLPFYIFAHKREIGLDEKFSLFSTGKFKTLEEIPTHRMIWQPRLTKPQAQINSMLFKAYPGTDMIRIIWMIPEREIWDEFKKGNMTQSQIVVESIDRFNHARESLEAKENDDPTEEQIRGIYREITTLSKYEVSSS